MHLKGVLKITSSVLIVVGISMLLSGIVSVVYGESPLPLASGAFGALIIGALLLWATHQADTNDLGVRDGCAVVTFSWIGASILGAIPFYVMHFVDNGIAVGIIKSIYETVSGFTTTGASIFTDVEILPKGILFWRSFTHWLGGMGIVVLAIAVLPKLGVGGMQSFRMESPGPLKADKLVPRISQTAKILYTVYLAITVIEVLALLVVKVNLFDALIHTFGTVGTGGFSNYNASVAGLKNPAAEYIIAFFMWLSGANFGLTFLVLWKRQIGAILKDVEFLAYTAITLIAIGVITLVLFLTHFHNLPFATILRTAVFQVPTILTTTGYATFNFNLWPASAAMVLVFLMFIGASTGSTGGGLKVLRHIINFKLMRYELMKIVKPNLVATVRLGSRPIEPAIVSSVVALTLIYLTTFAIGALILTFLNMDLISAITASIANLGNIGPGLGSVGPASNYASVHPIGLVVLIAEMLLGRLEVYTILSLLFPLAWSKKM